MTSKQHIIDPERMLLLRKTDEAIAMLNRLRGACAGIVYLMGCDSHALKPLPSDLELCLAEITRQLDTAIEALTEIR